MAILKGKKIWLLVDTRWYQNTPFSCFANAQKERRSRVEQYINEGYIISKEDKYATYLQCGKEEKIVAITQREIY